MERVLNYLMAPKFHVSPTAPCHLELELNEFGFLLFEGANTLSKFLGRKISQHDQNICYFGIKTVLGPLTYFIQRKVTW